MGSILEYFDVGRLHALVVGGYNGVMGSIVEYFDVGGLHALVIVW